MMREDFRDWETPATAIALCGGTAIATITSVCVAWNHPLRAYASVAGLGLGIWSQVLVQSDMRKNRRQKMVQTANDTIFDAGIEVYTTTSIQEMQPSRSGYAQPEIPYVTEADIEALPQPEPEQLEVYDWANIIDDASGCLVAGPSGYGKTSIGAGFLVGTLTQSEPAEVIALDIHASKNRIWKDLGFPRVVDDAREIYHIAEWLIGEIESRKRQDRHNIIVLLDEVNDLLSELEHIDGKKNGDHVKTLIYCIRKLSNGRKFGVTLIVFGQSHNVDAIGIDGKFRNNFSLILVGESARYEVLQELKKDSLEYQTLKHTAYPCVVSGNLPLMAAVHPTHGEYTKYKKKGNAPNNLIQPRFIMDGWLIPEFSKESSSESIKPPVQNKPPNHKPNPSDFDLSKPDEPPPTSEPEQPNIYQLIIELAISNGGSCTSREVRQTHWGRKYKADGIKVAFEVLERDGKGKVEVKKVPGGTSVVFHVIPPK